MEKLKRRLKNITENSYMELLILNTILLLMLALPGSLFIIYPVGSLVRDLTGRLLDPIMPLARRILSFEFFIVAGLIFFIIFITSIIILRVRKGKFLEGILIYDVFVSYHKDFKTMPTVTFTILFLFIYMIYFIVQLSYRGLEFFYIYISICVAIISLNLIAHISQINKVFIHIKNIGKFDTVEISGVKYLFTQKSLDLLQDTDENIKAAVEEQLKSERLKTELITNISHDLKTPLTSIINYTDLLKKHDTEDEQTIEYIDVLDRNSQRLKVLITDLVYASKAETGNVDIKLEPLELNELVSQVYGEFDYLFREKDITFVFDPMEDIYVLADSDHLGRVLINIMDNAIKYAQEGTRIYADTKDEGQYTSFTLKNISREQLNISPDELMEQFVRGERSRHTEGSGLGLYISRSLMELMEGKLTLGIDGDLFEVKLLIPSVEDDEE